MALRKLFSLLFCAAALLAGAGCSDSEGDISYDSADLIGTWNKTDKYDYIADEWVLNVERDDQLTKIAFKDDGTVTIDDYGSVTDVPYALNGTKLTIRESPGYSYRFTINKLTKTVLELHKKDIDDNYKLVYIRETE